MLGHVDIFATWWWGGGGGGGGDLEDRHVRSSPLKTTLMNSKIYMYEKDITTT